MANRFLAPPQDSASLASSGRQILSVDATPFSQGPTPVSYASTQVIRGRIPPQRSRNFGLGCAHDHRPRPHSTGREAALDPGGCGGRCGGHPSRSARGRLRRPGRRAAGCRRAGALGAADRAGHPRPGGGEHHRFARGGRDDHPRGTPHLPSDHRGPLRVCLRYRLGGSRGCRAALLVRRHLRYPDQRPDVRHPVPDLRLPARLPARRRDQLRSGVGRGRRRRSGMVAQCALSILAILPLSLAGHAAGAANHDTAVNSLAVLLVSAVLWVGGLLALVILRPLLGKALAVSVQRYSVLAGWCFVAVAASVAANARIRVGSLCHLASTHGALVILKVVALVILGLAGWQQRSRVVDRIAADPLAGRLFGRLALFELVVMGAAFALGAALSRSAPPGTDVPAF